MQNRTQEDGGNIFGADGRQYNLEADRCGQGPAIHIVGGNGSDFGLGLHIYIKIDSDIVKNTIIISLCVPICVYNASFFILLKAR